jgi:hypothetical protein
VFLWKKSLKIFLTRTIGPEKKNEIFKNLSHMLQNQVYQKHGWRGVGWGVQVWATIRKSIFTFIYVGETNICHAMVFGPLFEHPTLGAMILKNYVKNHCSRKVQINLLLEAFLVVQNEFL